MGDRFDFVLKSLDGVKLIEWKGISLEKGMFCFFMDVKQKFGLDMYLVCPKHDGYFLEVDENGVVKKRRCDSRVEKGKQ